MKDVAGYLNPGAPDIWWVKGNTPRPENIGPDDGIIQYKLINPGTHYLNYQEETLPIEGVMLIQAIAGGKIRVEVFKGSTSETAYTTAAKDYER